MIEINIKAKQSYEEQRERERQELANYMKALHQYFFHTYDNVNGYVKVMKADPKSVADV